MEIGKKLKKARENSKLTQEMVAEKINVTRQTISNWENENSYPDIDYVIMLSDLYVISIDELLKEDDNMVKYLKESTDTVKSNKKLIILLALNILLIVFSIIGLMIFDDLIINNKLILFLVFIFIVGNLLMVFYHIIRRV